MTTIRKAYPLVEERVLAPAPRTGRRFWNQPTRSHDELPRVSAHQVLVYRTGDQYLTDHGVRGPGDETVLNAGSVTVVDCRTDVPVTVGTDVPSAETDGFTVQVAFHCTVTDPVAVVREGVVDVESRLLGYLRALPGLTDVTQQWPLEAGKEVSRRLTARLIAYLEMEPPRITGLSVGAPYLTVLTPEEFAAQRRRADEERREHEHDRVKEAVRREREEMEHEREKERERMDAERKALEMRHQQELDDLRRSYTHRTDAENQHYTQKLKRKDNEFERTEALKDLEDFGTDPANTDILAQRRGEIAYSELAERQRETDRVRRERQREDEERHWENAERRRHAEREDLRYSLEREDRHREVDRQDQRAALDAARDEQREQRAADRDDRLRRRAEQREDVLADRAERRHRSDRRDNINQELGRQMINRGLLDNAPLDARAFVERLSTGQGLLDQDEPAAAAGAVGAAADTPQLKEGSGTSFQDRTGERPRAYDDEAPYERKQEQYGREYDAGDGRRDDPYTDDRYGDDRYGDGDGGGRADRPARDGNSGQDRDGDDDARSARRPLIADDDDLGEAGREERGR
ncbi:hypothetical protein OG304_11000 [Streptomyces sp. NBC_00160]|uniref:hypothetical protein n=1 Tax=Streptomyces sp. NBC_00160 TaxID=2903628 RepID=UPI002257A9F8|nr:hypothetical protein [Streptomyces sp. NBC_00160]MCX5303975.1 hypothetical protein [Streptomyces sp. NBC_00160]